MNINYLLSFENKIYLFIFDILLKRWINELFIPNNYTYFLQSSEIKNWENRDNLYFQKLNDLRDSAQATTQELFELESFDYYQGYVGELINNFLRKSNLNYRSFRLDRLNNYIETISTTLSKFEVENNIVVLRRTKAKIFENQKVNSEFQELGFLSTSINLSHRQDFEGNYKPFKNEALLILKVPSKTKGLYVEQVQTGSRRRNEYELLIQKGSRIRVEKNYKIFSNRIILGTVFQN